MRTPVRGRHCMTWWRWVMTQHWHELLNSQKLCDSSYVFVYKRKLCWVSFNRRCLFHSEFATRAVYLRWRLHWRVWAFIPTQINSTFKLSFVTGVNAAKQSHTSKQSFWWFGKLSELTEPGLFWGSEVSPTHPSMHEFGLSRFLPRKVLLQILNCLSKALRDLWKWLCEARTYQGELCKCFSPTWAFPAVS